jgi:inorganic triphosphatase YgiF
MKVESELKLTMTPGVAQRLLKSQFWKPLRHGRTLHRHLISTYFDTPQHLLRRSGVALRIREAGGAREQTLKVPVAGPAGLQNYEEWTMPVSGTRPSLASLRDVDSLAFLWRARSARRIEPVFTTEFDRTTMQLRTEAAEIELAVDIGCIRVERNGATREQAICELELELVAGDASALSDVALQICENWDALPAHQTKAERGYSLARASLRPRASKPGKVELRREMTAGEAFQIVISGALEHLYENRVPTLLGRPEGIHQTRVAMRRLRAALRAFKSLLPYHERKAFNGELRWFQQKLAPARDWHVFVNETLPSIGDSGRSRDEDVVKLRRVAVSERRRATALAREHLVSRRYARLILQFQKWVTELERTVSPGVWQQPVVPFARRVVHKANQELLRETRSLKRLPIEELHTLRKRAKKTRYATEFFASLWPAHEVTPYVRVIEQLQSRLGAANDAGVAGRILLTLRHGRLDPELMQLVQECSQQRVRECVDATRPLWRRFRSVRAFWRESSGTAPGIGEA